MDELHADQSDDERLVRRALRAAYPPVRSDFSQRRGEQIIRAAAQEQRDRRSLIGSRVAACVAASFTLLAGTAGAAGAALPGQPLYPLKRIVERAMVAVTSDKNGAARLELQFAQHRLREAQAVGTEEPAATSLAEKFNEHINAAEALGGPEVDEAIAELQRSRAASDRDGAGSRATTVEPQNEQPAPPSSRAPSAEPSPTPSATSTPSPSPSRSPSPTGAPPAVEPTPEPSMAPSELPSDPPSEVRLPDGVSLVPNVLKDGDEP